jgi:peptidoglycan hydrolase FlgJ
MINMANQVALDVQALGNLKHEAKTDPKAALRAAAQQFEALLTNQLLKQMRQASLSEDSTLGENGKMYLEMFDQQVAQKISQSKGLGLADMLVRQLAPQVAKTQPAVTAAGAATSGTTVAMPPAAACSTASLAMSQARLVQAYGVAH